jgi:hypothetical protein
MLQKPAGKTFSKVQEAHLPQNPAHSVEAELRDRQQ